MKLAYNAYDQSGQPVDGTIDAADPVDASERLRGQGLFVTKVVEVAAEAAADVVRTKRLGKGKRLKLVASFTRQLYVLISTGTPLAQTLAALQRQAKDPTWQTVLNDILERVRGGTSLSQAMRSHPRFFDPVYATLIEVGETGGDFPTMLDRLSMLTKKQQHVHSSIVGAMAYPCLLVTISLSVLGVMFTVVLPNFVELFDSMQVPLPPTTEALVVVANVLTGYWWLFLIGTPAAAFGFAKWLGTRPGKRAYDTAVLRIPRIGTVVRNFATARIVRLLGTLLASRVPLLQALELCGQATTNHHYADVVRDAQQAVINGNPVSAAFDKPDLITPSVYEAIRNGEHSGQLGSMMLNVAGFLDDENDVVLRSLTSIIEPLILVVLGVLVGFVAVSMFMPLFDLTAMAGGGGAP